MKGLKIEWPTVAVCAVFSGALVGVYAFSSPDQRDVLLHGVGAVGSLALAFLRPLLVKEPQS